MPQDRGAVAALTGVGFQCGAEVGTGGDVVAVRADERPVGDVGPEPADALGTELLVGHGAHQVTPAFVRSALSHGGAVAAVMAHCPASMKNAVPCPPRNPVYGPVNVA